MDTYKHPYQPYRILNKRMLTRATATSCVLMYAGGHFLRKAVTCAQPFGEPKGSGSSPGAREAQR